VNEKNVNKKFLVFFASRENVQRKKFGGTAGTNTVGQIQWSRNPIQHRRAKPKVSGRRRSRSRPHREPDPFRAFASARELDSHPSSVIRPPSSVPRPSSSVLTGCADLWSAFL